MTFVDPIQYVCDFFFKINVVILLGCYFSGSAIRDSKSSDRIIEVILAVGLIQKTLSNWPFQDQLVNSIIFIT